MDGSHIPLPFISESFLKENASLEPLSPPAAHLERGWGLGAAGAPQGSGASWDIGRPEVGEKRDARVPHPPTPFSCPAPPPDSGAPPSSALNSPP